MGPNDMKWLVMPVMAVWLSGAAFAEEPYVAACSQPVLRHDSCYQECWCKEDISNQKWTFYIPPDALGQCRNVTSHQGEVDVLCANMEPFAGSTKPTGVVGLLLLQQLSQSQIFR